MWCIRSKVVKTRKPCTCFGCARQFPAGSKLRKNTLADNGAIRTIAYCPVCDEYWDRYMEIDDMINMGDLKSEEPEQWEALRIEVEGVDS